MSLNHLWIEENNANQEVYLQEQQKYIYEKTPFDILHFILILPLCPRPG